MLPLICSTNISWTIKFWGEGDIIADAYVAIALVFIAILVTIVEVFVVVPDTIDEVSSLTLPYVTVVLVVNDGCKVHWNIWVCPELCAFGIDKLVVNEYLNVILLHLIVINGKFAARYVPVGKNITAYTCVIFE